MKTSEQTKRAISVGLITTAWVVIVASATLFCGVTAARAQESDNRIDWRWGRPGVMVVTNAPTAVTVTNIATTVATEVAGGVAENLFGPRVSALEGGTNNWNTAYGWGDHAGLYRAIGWVPSWGDLTDIPQDFPPSTHEHDYTAVTNPPWLTEYIETDEIALAALYGTNAILRAAITNEAALWAAHTNDTENPHGVTAAQIGAATTGELAAVEAGMAAYATTQSVAAVEAALAGYQSAAYWPPNATASSWFTFTTNSGVITITGYNIEGGTDVVIPDYINGWPVTAIGENAFAGSGVTSIGGAGNVVTVGDYAFNSCSSLTSVSLPQAQTVGDNAFNSCSSLTSVLLPQAQTVGNYAFSSCSSLTSVSLPQAQTVGNSAFYFCYSLTSVYFDNGAPTIGNEIFEFINPNQVTIYVTNPQATGWGDKLGDMPVVRIPLYADAIYQAGELVATEAHVAEQIAGYQSAAYWPPDATASSWFTFTTNSGAITITGYNIAGGTDVVIPDYINGWPVTEIGANAFDKSGVTSIGGAGNVVTVGDYAFSSCYSLTSVSLPQVQTVGDYAFSSCFSLTSVSLPQAQTVGNFAFSYCYSLTSVLLPQAQTVGDYAFDSCTSLASLYFDGNAPTIGAEIFAGITPNQVTNYVTNPQATGWGDKLGRMPVVRLDLYGDKIYQDGELVATTGHVAQAIAGKVDMDGGTATNLWLQGETIVSDSYTNLWWRNVYSNGWHWLVAYTNAPGGGE